MHHALHFSLPLGIIGYLNVLIPDSYFLNLPPTNIPNFTRIDSFKYPKTSKLDLLISLLRLVIKQL